MQKVAEQLEESPSKITVLRKQCSRRRESRGGEERAFCPILPRPESLHSGLKNCSVFSVFALVTRNHTNEPGLLAGYADSAIAVAPGFLEKSNFAFPTLKPISVLFLSLSD